VDVVTVIGSLDTILAGEPASAVCNVIAYGTIGSRILGQFGNSPTLLGASGTDVYTAYAGSGPVSATLGNSLTYTAGVKVGVSWNSSGRSVVGGGGTVGSDSAHGGVANTTLGHSNQPIWFGYYRRLTTWTSRLADATLQGFTNP
jgi:hypothetical protein